MGLFGQLFKSTTREIESYEVIFEDGALGTELVLRKLKGMLESTKKIKWGSKVFTWHTYDWVDEYTNNTHLGGIDLVAAFQREYGTGHRVYIDSDHSIAVSVSMLGDTLGISWIPDGINIAISINAKLRK